MSFLKNSFKHFLIWRIRNIPERQFVLVLSIIIGFTSGMGAVLIKNVTYDIKKLINQEFIQGYFDIFYFIFPIVGLFLTFLASKLLIGHTKGQGISDTLHALSMRDGVIAPKAMYTPLINAPFTVGFGGSVGLEGATVYMGSAIGSNLSRLFHLNTRNVNLLIGCAASGALASVFHAPIGALIFAIEIFSLDLTLASLVPMLLASTTGAMTSILIYGDETIFSFTVKEKFELQQIPFYLLLGMIGALTSLYFTFIYKWMGRVFKKMGKPFIRLIVGSVILGLLVYLFPSLYGEGYASMKALLAGKQGFLLEFNNWQPTKNHLVLALLLFCIVLFKAFATTATIGAVSVGGIFGPSLMSGCCMGYGVGLLINYAGIGHISPSNFALVGMATQMAGVMYAPLTAIFMISELTGTYDLMIPLMICSAISYSINRYFNKYNVYQEKLAQLNMLVTHDKDKAVLTMLSLDKVIETNFITLSTEDTLGEMLHSAVAKSNRNIFPVVDVDDTFLGVVTLDDIRTKMFDHSQYDTITVGSLMRSAPEIINQDDDMDVVMEKFKLSGAWNLPVCDGSKYVGFVSKSKVLAVYRRKLIHIASDD
ncbi:MAG TPA: chloride channel protein [Saprospiraceae bacterium]|nr:chloride channel protein [Saprospiraceae bacterium]